MKKLAFMFVAFAAISFASCGNKEEVIVVDSTVADSAAAEAVVADSAVVEAPAAE